MQVFVQVFVLSFGLEQWGLGLRGWGVLVPEALGSQPLELVAGALEPLPKGFPQGFPHGFPQGFPQGFLMNFRKGSRKDSRKNSCKDSHKCREYWCRMDSRKDILPSLYVF